MYSWQDQEVKIKNPLTDFKHQNTIVTETIKWREHKNRVTKKSNKIVWGSLINTINNIKQGI